MYCYIVCRFLKELSLGAKPYVYEVRKELFDKVKIGYHYKIKNSNGYSYQDAFVEVTGKYRTARPQKIKNDYLVNEEDAKFDSLPIKELVVMEEAGKRFCANEVQGFISEDPNRSSRTPISFKGDRYSDVESLSKAVKRAKTMIHPEYQLGIDLSGSVDLNNTISNSITTPYLTINGDGITFTTSSPVLDDDLKELFGIKEDKKEKKTMNKIFGNVEFGKYTGREIKMSVNGLAYLAENGKYVAYDKSKLTLTDVTDFVFDMEGLLYLLPVAIKDIQVGDIIKHGGAYVIVKDIAGGNFLEVIEPCTNEVKTIMPLRNIFGFDFYTKVVSLMGEGAFGTIDESNPFGNMLPFFLMTGDKNTDGFDAKTFMLMNMFGGGAMDFNSNPYLMMMLFDNKGDMGDILPLMMFTNGGNFFHKKETCDCNCKKEN